MKQSKAKYTNQFNLKLTDEKVKEIDDAIIVAREKLSVDLDKTSFLRYLINIGLKELNKL